MPQVVNIMEPNGGYIADHDVDDRDKAEVVDADAEASCHRQQQRVIIIRAARRPQRNIPMMSRMTFVSNRNTYLLEVRFRTAVVTILGRLIQVMYCPKTPSGDHDQNDARSTGNGIEDDGDKVLAEGQALIDELAYNEAVQNCDSAALRRGEHAETHTQDDAEGEEQAPEGVERLLGNDLCGGTSLVVG